jgi:NAD(P)H-hydrate epimerase
MTDDLETAPLLNGADARTLNGTRPANASVIPALNPRQHAEIFRLMVEEYGWGQLVLLENAGRNLATLARRLLGGNLAGKRVVLFAGAGNCGAAGMAAARYLSNAGADLQIILSRPVSQLEMLALHEYRMLTRAGIPCLEQPSLPALKLSLLLQQAELVVDALIGGGLHSWTSGAEAFLIQITREFGNSVLALDLPSGLPPDGQNIVAPNLLMKATATLALGLPRLGHILPHTEQYVGELYLADIGVPSQLFAKMGLNVGTLFSASDIILLRQKKT